MNKHIVLFLNILLLASIGQIAADMYLPSLPAIASSMMVDASAVQWSVSLYMWGFAASQVIYGPLSDAVGRRAPLIVGLCILSIGSVICMLATSIQVLIIGRFLQGIGAGSGASLSWVILRDTFEGEKMAKYGSYLAMSGIILMASAPLLGGFFQWIFGWHANFIFLTLYSLAVLIVVMIKLPETNCHRNMKHLKKDNIHKNISVLMNHSQFISYCIIVMISYGGILAWLTVGPIVLQNESGLTPIQFGYVAVLTGASYGICNFINSKCVEYFKSLVMIRFGLSLMLIASCLMILLWCLFHSTSLAYILIPTVVFVGGTGFVFSNSIASALSPFPKIAGFAGSVFGCFQILGGAVSSGILASVSEHNQIPLGIVMLCCSLVGFAAFIKIWSNSSQTRQMLNPVQ